MWVVMNNIDRTSSVQPQSLSIDMALGDPLTTASFEVTDPTSSINLDFNYSVMIWDENAAPDYTIARQPVPTVPSINILHETFVTGGTYAANVALNIYNQAFTFNNASQTGPTHDAHVTTVASSIAYGYITPGQTYMYSFFINCNAAPTALNYYYQINWLDINLNLLSSTVSTPTTPPVNNTQVHISGVAPANAAFAQAQFGVYATSSTNNGVVNFANHNITPVWFAGKSMGDGTPITYPTPDCNGAQVNSAVMPDGTFCRLNRLFYGYISNLEAKYDGIKRTWTVDCRSMGDVIENGGIGTPIDITYTNFTDTGIINDLINTYFPGLLSTGQVNSSRPPTTIVTGQTIPTISFTDQTFREVLNSIVDITGFVFYIDQFLYVHYNPIPYDYSNFSLLIDPDPLNQPDYFTIFPPQEYTYIKDGTQIRNSVKVTGGTLQVTVQDVFSGDGSTTKFVLSQIPVSITSVSTNGGSSTYAPTSSNLVGVSGQDTNGTNGVVVLMDSSNHSVTFNTAPGSGSNNVVITYVQNRPATVLVEENTSIGTYKRRFVSKVEDTNLASNAAAKLRGESEIAQWAYPVQNITFKLSSQMDLNRMPLDVFIRPGTTIFLTSTLDNLTNQPFVIQTVKVSSLGGGINVYENEGGVYRPTLRDSIRNVQKSLARNPSTGGTTPIQLTFEVLRDTMTYVDAVVVNPHGFGAIDTWGTGRYGQASFS